MPGSRPGHDTGSGREPRQRAAFVKGGYVYIMSNKRNGTLYIGVTSDLSRRVREHRESIIEGFTKRYGLKCLV
jgi:predicted GIY-YIG superfamily endonuclease